MVPNPTAAYVDTLARRHHDNQKIIQPKLRVYPHA